MPPKKNVVRTIATATRRSQEKRPAKPILKQVKPNPKTPALKLKIPVESSTKLSPAVAEIKIETSPKLTRKQLTVEKKLDLANEVAAVQLGNRPPTILDATPPVVIVPPTRKRGRRKKEPEPSDCASASLANDSEDVSDVTPKKRNSVRKKPTKATAKKPEAVDAVVGTQSLSLSPKKKTIKQTKLTDAKSGITKTPKSTVTSNKSSSVEALVTECRTRRKKLQPGKTDKETEVFQPPSMLDQVETQNSNIENPLMPAGSPKSDPNVEPCFINSRKTSATSECLSWTKDISSSSTTTCVTVCSTDIVRIDKKMPMIKLTPTMCHLNQNLNTDQLTNAPNESSSSESSDSSESECSTNRSPQRECTPEIETRSLNLSSPSISPNKSPQPATPNSDNDEMSKITYCIDKLTSKLKHFDLEIINWIGYETEEVNLDRKKFQDSILSMLKEETEVIAQCRYLKKILSNSIGEEDANEKCVEVEIEDDVKKVDSDTGDNNLNDQYQIEVAERSDEENNFTTDRVRYIPFEQSCDDDDALSLFAESITGIESSRRNSTATSMCGTTDVEEYVPLPIDDERWEPARKISYPPPRSLNKQIDIKTKPVCEKQNADSTSIYKDSEQPSLTHVAPLNKTFPPLSINTTLPMKKKPGLMSHVFKPLMGVKSGVFQGICFYNILSSCKKAYGSCRFPHLIPSNDEITAKLVRLSEEMFIQEYMLMRNWPILRRKYGMCFVHECIRRDLTRILVEMALDFVMKANESCRHDITLKVLVIECVLSHLNNVDLEICEDLLICRHQGELLCEIFMRVIANTQNFSRFKMVFISLTKFILKQERTFSLHIATQMLERICILPAEPQLLEALFVIVKNTDRAILQNSMLSHFENQLSVVSKELYDELLKLKKDATLNRPVLQNLYASSPKASPKASPADIEPVNANPLVSEREKRYTSPDTTNLDAMNKPADEPIITRTIDFSRAQRFECTIQRSFSNSNSPNGSDEFRPKVVSKPNFKNWKDKSIFNNICKLSPLQRHGTPRPMMKRHVHQHLAFGPSPPKFPRRSGPDFF